MKPIQEIAELVCDLYTDINISPYATINGIEWTCEILEQAEGNRKNSVAICEGAASIEEAVNRAFEDFTQTVGPHSMQIQPKERATV